MREIDFSDGFESASPPTETGRKLTMSNNTATQTMTGLSVDGAIFKAAIVDYIVRRKTDSSERLSRGSFVLIYRESTSQWVIMPDAEIAADGLAASGVSFTVATTGGVGQPKVTTDDHTGANGSHLIYWQVRKFYA